MSSHNNRISRQAMANANPAAAAAVPSRSPLALAVRRFRKNTRAVAALVLLLAILAETVLVPALSPYRYDQMDWKNDKKPPTLAHWFGTDWSGRDLLVRSFMGGRISFAVGILGTTVAVGIGLFYGSLSGFLGGKTDLLLMRFVDVLYGLPYMLIVIIAMTLFDPKSAAMKLILVFLVLGCFGWLTMARIVRGQVLSLKEREFVEAARALGGSTLPIIWRHMIPNLLGPVVVYATLTIPAIMLQEAFLSYLGLGIGEPMPSWGSLIDKGAQNINPIRIAWWLIVMPGGLLALTLYALNALGDGIRDAVDVQQR